MKDSEFKQNIQEFLNSNPKRVSIEDCGLGSNVLYKKQFRARIIAERQLYRTDEGDIVEISEKDILHTLPENIADKKPHVLQLRNSKIHKHVSEDFSLVRIKVTGKKQDDYYA